MATPVFMLVTFMTSLAIIFWLERRQQSALSRPVVRPVRAARSGSRPAH